MFALERTRDSSSFPPRISARATFSWGGTGSPRGIGCSSAASRPRDWSWDSRFEVARGPTSLATRCGGVRVDARFLPRRRRVRTRGFGARASAGGEAPKTEAPACRSGRRALGHRRRARRPAERGCDSRLVASRATRRSMGATRARGSPRVRRGAARVRASPTARREKANGPKHFFRYFTGVTRQARARGDRLG